MNIKKLLVYLSISVSFLIVALILYIVIEPVTTEEVNHSIEYKKYATLFNLELVETEDDKYYVITGLNKDYSKGENKDGNLVIPEAIDDIPVKKLVSKEKSFSDYRDITKIVISKNIIYIGTSTTDESLGNKIFKEAYNLKFIEVSEENPVYKSLNGILFNKDASILLKMPNRFVFNEDFNYTIPSTVKEIYTEAFVNNSSIKSVTISSSVLVIGRYAFNNCEALTTVKIADNPVLEKIEIGAFKDCSNLKEFNTPSTVKEIGNLAFSSCIRLDKIFIPSSVETFGTYIATASPNVIFYTTSDNLENLRQKYENLGIKSDEIVTRIMISNNE